jgi:hypothetical protein
MRATRSSLENTMSARDNLAARQLPSAVRGRTFPPALLPASSDGTTLRRARAGFALAAGVLLFYFALAPWRIGDRGYNGQDIRAADDALSGFSARIHGRPAPPQTWSRHGVLGFAPHLPFILASRIVPGSDASLEERAVSMEPIVETVLIVLLLFLWIERLGFHRRAIAVSLAAAFTTMLWPYAYIGLETSQSLALFAAGFLALAPSETQGRWRTPAFVTADILAVSLKSTGIFLIPAAAYLAVIYFGDATRRDGRRVRRAVAISAVIALVIFAGNAWTRELFWGKFGGSRASVMHTLVRDPFLYIFHVVSLVSSPNKGLLFYAPLAVLGLVGIGGVFRRSRRVAIFAILTTSGLVGGFSLLKIWSDETWGPRYLHSAIAPLLLCLALSDGVLGRRVGRAVACLLAAAGLVVSLLGALFYYGWTSAAARIAGQSNLEWIQSDVVWNPIRFDLRLLRVILDGGRGKEWVAAHYWWFFREPGSPPEAVIDLSRYAHLQGVLFRPECPPAARVLLVLSGLSGLGILLFAFRRAFLSMGSAAIAGLRRVSLRRRAVLPVAILFWAIQGGSWLLAVERTGKGRFHQLASDAEISPAFLAEVRRVAAAASGDSGPILCITRRPQSLIYFEWQRLLYPRRLIPIRPEAIGTGELETLRRARGARHAISLGDGSAPFDPGYRNRFWVEPDVLVGELSLP